jgi:plasmid stabilization system protein ParE
MNYTVDLIIKARQEIFESWVWYEEQQTGLGERFEADVFRKIHLIAKNPLHYPQKGKYHECNADVFPYLIVFRLNQRKRLITVISVFHTSRHPKKKY